MDGDKQEAAADQAAAAAGDGKLNVAREGGDDGAAAGAADGAGQQAAGDTQQADEAATAAAAAKEAEAAALAKAAGIVGRTVVLHTQFGPIKVKLLEQLAPKTTSLVWQLAQARGCKDCAFYRCALWFHAVICCLHWHQLFSCSGCRHELARLLSCLLSDAVHQPCFCCIASLGSLADQLPPRHPACTATRPSRGWGRGRPMRCCRAACRSWQRQVAELAAASAATTQPTLRLSRPKPLPCCTRQNACSLSSLSTPPRLTTAVLLRTHQSANPDMPLALPGLHLPQKAPLEGAIEVKMGHVCFIPGTHDFFVAYGDHPEWGTAHTVRGWCLRMAGAGGLDCSRQRVATGGQEKAFAGWLHCKGAVLSPTPRLPLPMAAGVGPCGRVVCHRLHHLAAIQVRSPGWPIRLALWLFDECPG